MLVFALDQVQASMEESRRAKEARKFMNKYMEEVKIKMTREEATYKVQRKSGYEGICARELVDALEVLGLLKFDEPKTIDKWYEERIEPFGVVRVESWPEGLVVWIGGEIVYRSWKR